MAVKSVFALRNFKILRCSTLVGMLLFEYLKLGRRQVKSPNTIKILRFCL
jgi:hypothetical protein